MDKPKQLTANEMKTLADDIYDKLELLDSNLKNYNLSDYHNNEPEPFGESNRDFLENMAMEFEDIRDFSDALFSRFEYRY